MMLKHVAWGFAAALLGSGASLVWAAGDGNQYRASDADNAVLVRLKQKLPKTQVSRVNCQIVGGVCEVTAGSQIFYIDQSARYLMIGRIFDLETRQDLTAARLVDVNPDLLIGGAAGSRREAEATQAQYRGQNNAVGKGMAKTMSLTGLPEAGGIVWGNPTGKTVTVFSDFSCGYCKALSAALEQLDVRVIERPISILGSRAVANQVYCARDRRKALKAAYAGQPITDSRNCDTSALDANERFARENGISGTPVLVRSDGAVIEGYRPKEYIANWLKGAQS
jgi:thiol:disulfide interchange protein DsbC